MKYFYKDGKGIRLEPAQDVRDDPSQEQAGGLVILGFVFKSRESSKRRLGSPAEGQIQIQSEGHGVEIRHITIKPL